MDALEKRGKSLQADIITIAEQFRRCLEFDHVLLTESKVTCLLSQIIET